MTAAVIAGLAPLQAAYVAVFGLTGLACGLAAVRASLIEDVDTRRGLTWLLITSATWAGAQAAYLAVPWPNVAVGLYLVGLVVGFATVGPWLYFCSGFTGRSLHRDRTLQSVAVATFLVVVALKLTNSVHGLYFTATVVEEPFTYVAIQLNTLHWIAMGIAYALAAVGYFMLLELFVQVDYDGRPLAVLVAVTGLPVALAVLSPFVPALLAMSYEPLGVAVFALGVLFLFLDRMQAIRLAGGRDEPVILLEEDGSIRDYNADALELYPTLRESLGERLATAIPELATVLGTDDRAVLSLEREGVTRYYNVSQNRFAAGRTGLGEMVLLSDVTEREQYRRELERQNERLEEFASMVSHDLRNPLNVATGRLEIAREDDDSEHLEAASDALDRMDTLIEDVLALARQGQPIDETEPVALSALAEQAWSMVEAPEVDLVVETDRRIECDPDRLQQLFENLFRNAIDHGGDLTTVRVGELADGFFVEDDGKGIPPDERDEVLAYGFSTAEQGTGFGLGIVAEIVEAHGWSISVAESEDGGARFEISGVNGS